MTLASAAGGMSSVVYFTAGVAPEASRGGLPPPSLGYLCPLSPRRGEIDDLSGKFANKNRIFND